MLGDKAADQVLGAGPQHRDANIWVHLLSVLRIAWSIVKGEVTVKAFSTIFSTRLPSFAHFRTQETPKRSSFSHSVIPHINCKPTSSTWKEMI